MKGKSVRHYAITSTCGQVQQKPHSLTSRISHHRGALKADIQQHFHQTKHEEYTETQHKSSGRIQQRGNIKEKVGIVCSVLSYYQLHQHTV